MCIQEYILNKVQKLFGLPAVIGTGDGELNDCLIHITNIAPITIMNTHWVVEVSLETNSSCSSTNIGFFSLKLLENNDTEGVHAPNSENYRAIAGSNNIVGSINIFLTVPINEITLNNTIINNVKTTVEME